MGSLTLTRLTSPAALRHPLPMGEGKGFAYAHTLHYIRITHCLIYSTLSLDWTKLCNSNHHQVQNYQLLPTAYCLLPNFDKTT